MLWVDWYRDPLKVGKTDGNNMWSILSRLFMISCIVCPLIAAYGKGSIIRLISFGVFVLECIAITFYGLYLLFF